MEEGVISKAREFASARGKVLVPLREQRTPMAVGQFAAYTMDFKIVDQAVPTAKEVPGDPADGAYTRCKETLSACTTLKQKCTKTDATACEGYAFLMFSEWNNRDEGMRYLTRACRLGKKSSCKAIDMVNIPRATASEQTTTLDAQLKQQQLINERLRGQQIMNSEERLNEDRAFGAAQAFINQINSPTAKPVSAPANNGTNCTSRSVREFDGSTSVRTQCN